MTTPKREPEVCPPCPVCGCPVVGLLVRDGEGREFVIGRADTPDGPAHDTCVPPARLGAGVPFPAR